MQKASELGNGKASNILGFVFENGTFEGVSQDKTRALGYFKLSTDQGFKPSAHDVERLEKGKTAA